MKTDIRLRVASIIRQLNYNQIRLRRLDIDKVRNWCYINLPKTVNRFKQSHFDLNEATTWEEIAAYNTVLEMYGRKIAVYFTFGWLDYQSVKDFIKSKKGEKFRRDFNLDHHSAILLSPTTFFTPESLDEFWVSFDLKGGKGYNFLDYSHYNEDEDLDSNLAQFQWLNEALKEQENEKIKNPYESTNRNRTKQKNVTPKQL